MKKHDKTTTKITDKNGKTLQNRQKCQKNDKQDNDTLKRK